MIAEKNLRTLTALVAICGLIFGIVKFIRVQEIEAAKPYLEKKPAWCEQAVQTASTIANSDNVAPADEKEFWKLYWGVMGMVEKREVTRAMIDFGDGLRSNANLKEKSLAIAHACRAELADD